MKVFRILLVLLVLAGVFAYFFLGDMISRAVVAAVNRHGPDFTGTTVQLGSARISPATGGGSIKDLLIGNPEGFSTPKAMSVGRVAVKVKPFSLLGDVVDIEEVVVEQPDFIFETKLTSSNLGTILDNIEKSTGGKAQPKPAGTGGNEADAKDATAEKKVILRHFVLEGATATLAVGNTSMRIQLPKLELHDIGVAKGGVTPAQAAGEIMPQVLKLVIRSAVSSLGERGLRERASDFGKELNNAAKDLINQLRGK
jgi:hypothetical protein